MNRKDHSRWFFGASWVVLIIAMCFVFVSAYWMVCPHEGLQMLDRPFHVAKPVVAQGELQTYKVRYCVKGWFPMHVNVDRGLTNIETGLLFPIASTIGHKLEKPCGEQFVAIGIPIFVPPGHYRLTLGTELRVNPFRTITQQWVTQEFEVVPFRGLPDTHPPVKD